MLPDLDDVTASYHRCRASDRFIDTFYEHFLAKSRAVAEKFRGTDFTRQKFMLRESLLMMLLFNRDDPEAVKELERLAERHSRRGADISPHLYSLWLDALCEAVKKHDPKYEPTLNEKWRVAMRPGIELLASKY